MGASEFFSYVSGKTAKDAFSIAVEEARYESGHGGYTGTIAEKSSFTVIGDVFESKAAASEYADELISNDDNRISDKWGPAGCLRYKNKDGEVNFLFFGYASS
jgi:hypothetical protein